MHSAPYSLIQTPQFKRAFAKFARKHPELREKTKETLLALRLHNLTGPLSSKQAVSITYAYRIVLCVEIVDREIVLHNIGTHAEVYG